MPAVLEPQVKKSPHTEQSVWFERAYGSLRDRYRRVDERTKEAFRRWRTSGGEAELQQLAAEKFPEADFVTVHDVPIFAEHVATERSGRVVKYDRRALEHIVARCNERILDTGDFAPLTAGHTPSKEGLPFPEVLGYDGPFRVGILGNKKPRWAIFVDEHIRKDCYAKAKSLPRRSPEVWAEPRMEDRILDPIAALGAETPRLDLGTVLYARRGDVVVEKYSSFVTSAAAMPSGSNTHLPGSVREKHAAADTTTPTEGAGSMLQPQDIQQIADAIMATKQWQWLTQKMDSEESSLPGADAGGEPGNMSPDADQMGDPGMPPADTSAPPDSPATAPPTPAPTPSAPAAAASPAAPAMSPLSDDEAGSLADDEKQQYGAMSHDGKCGYAAARRRYMAGAPTMRYSRASHDRLETEAEKLRDRVARLEDDKRQTERYSKLSTLAATYVFDVADEAKHCEAMSDEQFASHLTRVERYARHDDPTKVGYLPGLTEPVKTGEQKQDESTRRERYSRRAVQLADAARAKGQHLSYDDAHALAVAEDVPKDK